MFEIDRVNANKMQISILEKIEKFAINFPGISKITLSKKDYQQLYLLVPKACSKTEISVKGVLIVCQ